MSALAAEEERLERMAEGREPVQIISPVRLTGSYPETVLQVGTYDRARDEQRTYKQSIWKDAEFVTATKSFDAVTHWILDFLMYRRGG